MPNIREVPSKPRLHVSVKLLFELCVPTSVGTLLREEEKTTLLNWLKSASREWPLVIFLDILNLKDIIFIITTLGKRTILLLIGLNGYPA